VAGNLGRLTVMMTSAIGIRWENLMMSLESLFFLYAAFNLSISFYKLFSIKKNLKQAREQ
jgi:hypothetical protein